MTRPSRDQDTVQLDARNLRGLAHPVRVRLLGLLRTEGSSTATRLGRRLDLSSAATSYHLRQLADYGFVVEDRDAQRSHGRERWWRAGARSTSLSTVPEDPEAKAFAEEYLRAIAGRLAEKVVDWLDEMSAAPPEWQRAGSLNDTQCRLTADEAEELNRRIGELVEQARRLDPGRRGPRGSQPVSVQWQVLPRLGRRA